MLAYALAPIDLPNPIQCLEFFPQPRVSLTRDDDLEALENRNAFGAQL